MCNYQGHEFGASYPDSMCIDGMLWDADSEDDGMLMSGGEMCCPRCNTKNMLEEALTEAKDGGCGMVQFSPYCGATVWENRVARALRENEAEARAFLATVEPFETDDWPDREAVYARMAPWDHTVPVIWTRAALAHGSGK